MYRNTETRSCNHFCSEKAIIFTYSEFIFVALGIRHEMRMRHIVIFVLSGCTVFSTLSQKRYDFRKRLFNIKHVLYLYNFCL